MGDICQNVAADKGEQADGLSAFSAIGIIVDARVANQRFADFGCRVFDDQALSLDRVRENAAVGPVAYFSQMGTDSIPGASGMAGKSKRALEAFLFTLSIFGALERDLGLLKLLAEIVEHLGWLWTFE